MGTQRYTMFRGDTASWDFLVTDSSGNAVNITGFGIRFTAKKLLTDLDVAAVWSKTVGSGIVLKDQTAASTKGYCTATVVPADTLGLTSSNSNSLFYDWQVTDGSGVTSTLENGTILVVTDVGQTVP